MFSFIKINTEQDIIAGCQKNKRAAQHKLYEKYSNVLLGICIRYLKDKYLAEEVLTGGFLKIFDKIKQFEGKGSFEGWMRRIMVNECLMYLRKNKKIVYFEDIEVADEEVFEADDDAAWNADQLMAIVKKLPSGYRTVFNMYAIENYSHKEIAESLNISVGTSKSQLSKARKMIQEMMKQSSTELM